MIRVTKGCTPYYWRGAMGTIIKKHPVSGNVLVQFVKGDFKRQGNPWWVDPKHAEEI
jgi:hypothetical protein